MVFHGIWSFLTGSWMAGKRISGGSARAGGAAMVWFDAEQGVVRVPEESLVKMVLLHARANTFSVMSRVYPRSRSAVSQIFFGRKFRDSKHECAKAIGMAADAGEGRRTANEHEWTRMDANERECAACALSKNVCGPSGLEMLGSRSRRRFGPSGRPMPRNGIAMFLRRAHTFPPQV